MKLTTGAAALALAAMTNAATFTVTVGIRETDGREGLGFDPSEIVPQAGDTMQFTFQLPSYIKNGTDVQHTATRSTFEAPCTPKEGGFDIGLQTTTVAGGKSFTLLVNDTQPLCCVRHCYLVCEVLKRPRPRFYSYANKDCNAPMVLAVNPPLTGQTAASVQEAAKTATINHPTSPSFSSSASYEPSKTGTGSGSGSTGGSGSGEGTVNNGINCVLAFGAFLLALM